MNAKDVKKMCEWLAHRAKKPVTIHFFFTVAYCYAKGYKEGDEIPHAEVHLVNAQVSQFMTDGTIPPYIKKFWYEMVLPVVLKEG